MVRSARRYLPKLLKWAGIAFACSVALLLFEAFWYAQVHFLAHQDHVEARLAALPPLEADPPPAVADVIRTIEGDRVTYLVARAFVTETHGNRLRNGERHVLNALWTVLLPVTLDERELTALYSGTMYLGGGYGLVFGADHYFGKTPAELTRDEMLGLLVIARAPSSYAPQRNPNAYRLQLARYQEIFHCRKTESCAQR